MPTQRPTNRTANPRRANHRATVLLLGVSALHLGVLVLVAGRASAPSVVQPTARMSLRLLAAPMSPAQTPTPSIPIAPPLRRGDSPPPVTATPARRPAAATLSGRAQPTQPGSRAPTEMAPTHSAPIRATPTPTPTATGTATGTDRPASQRTESARDALSADPTASRPPRPLDLALPRGFAARSGAVNPALGDPRSNTARATPEQRMAKTFDTRLVEEQLGDGRVRLRRGDDCVIVTPSRIAQLMPFNDAAARTPSLVSACP